MSHLLRGKPFYNLAVFLNRVGENDKCSRIREHLYIRRDNSILLQVDRYVKQSGALHRIRIQHFGKLRSGVQDLCIGKDGIFFRLSFGQMAKV